MQYLDIRFRFVGNEVQRPATEGRKTGSEDHTGIDQIGALHDALIAHAFAFADQRVDQLATQPLQLELVVGLVGLGLDRLAVLPDV